MTERKKHSLKNIIQLPIIKIIIGGLFCILIPVLINKLVLDNIFQLLEFNDNLNRAIRVFITTIILMPLLYYFLFARLENRKITELRLRNTGITILILVVVFIVLYRKSYDSNKISLLKRKIID